MPTFRSKPRTITAEQFKGGVESHGYKIPTGSCFCSDGLEEVDPEIKIRWHVHTMHANQTVFLEPGDWIVPEPDGAHYYAIKDDVMKANWELVEVKDYCQRCGELFPLAQLTMVACEGVYCRKCLEMVEAGAETYECDGTNCPPRAHDHKVLI